jgi:hypothetical protein
MLSLRQWGGLDECQSCAMEQVLILALGAFPAADEHQHRGVQAGGVGPSRALGNNDLDKEDIAGRMLCLQQYRSERRCRLIGQMIGMSPEHLFPTSGT